VGKALDSVTEKQDPPHKFPEPWIPWYHQMQRRQNGAWEAIRTTIFREAPDFKPKPMFMLGRLSRDSHMGAFCGNYCLHPEEPRFFSMPEMRALTGYPTDYFFKPEDLKACQTVFAQAVMPCAGDFIMGSTVKAMQTEWTTGRKPGEVLLYDWRLEKKLHTVFFKG
jgi:site-specific DNA-cytosine methylase